LLGHQKTQGEGISERELREVTRGRFGREQMTAL
jgi:hypothetical protein